MSLHLGDDGSTRVCVLESDASRVQGMFFKRRFDLGCELIKAKRLELNREDCGVFPTDGILKEDLDDEPCLG